MVEKMDGDTNEELSLNLEVIQFFFFKPTYIDIKSLAIFFERNKVLFSLFRSHNVIRIKRKVATTNEISHI